MLWQLAKNFTTGLPGRFLKSFLLSDGDCSSLSSLKDLEVETFRMLCVMLSCTCEELRGSETSFLVLAVSEAFTWLPCNVSLWREVGKDRSPQRTEKLGY